RRLVDAAEAYGAMAPVVPLRGFRPLVAERDYHHEIGLLQINRLRLMSWAPAPVQFNFEPTACVPLEACFSGCRFARTREGVLASRAGSGLLLPSGPTDLWGGASSVVMALEPADLARAAAAMAGKASTFAPSEGAAPSICRFQARELSTLQARQLHALLQHLDICLGSHPALPARLGLDEVLLRLVVSWLQPQLLQERPGDRQRILERAGHSSFDELLDTMRANLDQPLRLSDLERMSHYSKRALQYAFRKKLGCTPNQWIRQQRLEKAMRQLEQGGRGARSRPSPWPAATGTRGTSGSALALPPALCAGRGGRGASQYTCTLKPGTVGTPLPCPAALSPCRHTRNPGSSSPDLSQAP
ncbi:MAG: helix-turn-helix domain-containing protein, partial [Cyanobium sp.]